MFRPLAEARGQGNGRAGLCPQGDHTAVPHRPSRFLQGGCDVREVTWARAAEPGRNPTFWPEISLPPLLSGTLKVYHHLCRPRGRPRLPALPPHCTLGAKALTGITRSRQMLKFFLWFGFSFLSENLVSPINSLWPNLSSSQTEILRSTEGVRSERRAYTEHLLSTKGCG